MKGYVYRALKRDAHGDPVDERGNVVHLGGATDRHWEGHNWAPPDATYVGVIDGLIFGNKTSAPIPRSDGVSTEGLIGYPVRDRRAAHEEVLDLCYGDIVVVDGVRYVIGNVLWGKHPHALSGRSPRFRWVEAKSRQ